MPQLLIEQINLSFFCRNDHFGASVKLENGLNILHGNNSAGKSLLLNSIVYALGLEGMFGPSHVIPLPAALTEELEWQGRKHEVLSARVQLTIRNGKGDAITVARQTKGTSDQRQIISVLDESTNTPKDYYVRIKGGATAERGFHRWLADWLDIALPTIETDDGRPAPLYLEALFPFLFVEQQAGWRDIAARMPTYLRIPDLFRRAVQFILDLSPLDASISLAELRHKKDEMLAHKDRLVAMISADAQHLGLQIKGDLTSISKEDDVSLHVFHAQAWLNIKSYFEVVYAEISQMTAAAAPVFSGATEAQLRHLGEMRRNLAHLHRVLADASESLSLEEGTLSGVIRRIEASTDDLVKHKEERTIRERGGVYFDELIAGRCPACGQSIPETLAGGRTTPHAMSLDVNISYLQAQADTLHDMRRQMETSIRASRAKLKNVKAEAVQTAKAIDEIRASVEVPAQGEIAQLTKRRALLEMQRERIAQFDETFSKTGQQLIRIHEAVKKLDADIRDLRNKGLNTKDLDKLGLLERSYVEQLKIYGFSSFQPKDIRIDRESYTPTYNDMPIGYTSASDAIRGIWAYLLAFLEVARAFPTNHLGTRIFDEPRQQSAAEYSLKALLSRASSASDHGQQVIFATSEPMDRLEKMIAQIKYRLITLPAHVLTPSTLPI